MWKKWKKFVHFTNRHFCGTDFHISLPDASRLNSSFGVCIEHLLNAGHCGRYGEWLNTIPAIKDLLRLIKWQNKTHTHTLEPQLVGINEERETALTAGEAATSSRLRRYPCTTLSPTTLLYHKHSAGNHHGQKKKKAVNWLPQLRRNQKTTFPPLSSMLNTNNLVKRWRGSPRMWTDVRIFVTYADDE